MYIYVIFSLVTCQQTVYSPSPYSYSSASPLQDIKDPAPHPFCILSLSYFLNCFPETKEPVFCFLKPQTTFLGLSGFIQLDSFCINPLRYSPSFLSQSLFLVPLSPFPFLLSPLLSLGVAIKKGKHLALLFIIIAASLRRIFANENSM